MKELIEQYEKDITESLGNNRNLILLGVRADSDIKYLNNTIEELRKKITLIRTATLDEVEESLTKRFTYYGLNILENITKAIDNLRGNNE